LIPPGSAFAAASSSGTDPGAKPGWATISSGTVKTVVM
jgi:hypothetical protein